MTTTPTRAQSAKGEESAVCLCVKTHHPPVLMYESHHVWPLGMGGPDADENRVWLCPTAHYNTHELLRLMLRHGAALHDHELQRLEDRPVSRHAAQIARRGYLSITTRKVVDE